MTIPIPAPPIIPGVVGPPVFDDPYTNIAPFTIRDSATYLAQVETIIAWIKGIVPQMNASDAAIVAAWIEQTEVITNDVNTALASQADQVDSALLAQATAVNTALTEQKADVDQLITDNVNFINAVSADLEQQMETQNEAVNTALTNNANFVNSVINQGVEDMNAAVAEVATARVQDPVIAEAVVDEESETHAALTDMFGTEIETPGTPARDAVDEAVATGAASVATTSRLRTPIPPQSSNVAAIVGAFFSGHGWTTFNAGNADTVNADYTTDFLLGSQSYRIVSKGDGTQFGWSKAGITLDLTGRHVRIVFKVMDLTMLGSLRLYLGDSTLANNINVTFLAGGTSRGGVARSGEWVTYDIPLVLFATVGSPSLSAITTIRLIGTDGGAGKIADVRLGGVGAVPRDELNRFPNGVVSFTFDDTFASQFTIARPYLDRYGYRGTLFPILDRIDTAGYLTMAQIKQMRDQGWEIGAHATTTATHNTGIDVLPESDVITLLEELRQWNADNGMMSTSFAQPLGYWNAASGLLVSRYYDSARIATASGPVNVRPEMPYRVMATNAGVGQINLANLIERVDRAKAEKAHLCLMFHDIKTSGATANDVNTADFQALVDHIATQGLAVRNYGEVLAAAVA